MALGGMPLSAAAGSRDKPEGWDEVIAAARNEGTV
jgi:hypothetical protein